MKSRSIFIIDDSELILSNLKRLLKSAKHRVAGTAGTVDSAIKWLSENEVSTVIVDLHLPDGSGLEIIRWLNSNKLGVEVIVFSNYTSSIITLEAIKAGANKVFDKSNDIESLLLYLDTI